MSETQTFQEVAAHIVREANDRIMTVSFSTNTHGLRSFASILKECEELSHGETDGISLILQHAWVETGQKLFSAPLTREAIELAGTNAMLKLRR